MARKSTKPVSAPVRTPRKRTVAPKPRAATAVAAPKPVVEKPAPARKVPALPVLNGVQVIAILNDGRETDTMYHVRMADGTTRHAEKSLFSQ